MPEEAVGVFVATTSSPRSFESEEFFEFAPSDVGEDAAESRHARVRTELGEAFLNLAATLGCRIETGSTARRRSAGRRARY
jgi:hypothetical protein